MKISEVIPQLSREVEVEPEYDPMKGPFLFVPKRIGKRRKRREADLVEGPEVAAALEKRRRLETAYTMGKGMPPSGSSTLWPPPPPGMTPPPPPTTRPPHGPGVHYHARACPPGFVQRRRPF